MPPALFALSTAFLFALHNVLIKKGLATSDPGTAVLISLAVNIVLLWTVALITVPFHYLAAPAVLVFVVVGLFQPGLTRLLTIRGIETLGVAITDPIRATTPMFAAFMAILFLDELMTLPILVGTFLIIGGVAILSQREGSQKTVRFRYVLFPILASLLGGISQVMRKYGLEFIPHPFLAAAITATASFAVVACIRQASRKGETFLKITAQAVPFYLAAGVSISLGMVALYYALALGEVVVVIPITSSGPLFALTLSALFLKETESITPKIILGACLIIVGVLIITLWKHLG